MGLFLMSTLAAWSYVEGPCTVWPLDENNSWGEPQIGAPYLIPAVDYEFGGDLARDESGTEFVPKTTVYFEALQDSAIIPEREWYIKLGDHLAEISPPPDAERIRAVSSWPMTKFGAGEIPDWQIMT